MLQDQRSGALPGQVIAVLDPDRMLVVDVFPCEDGHAQERSLFPELLETVQAKEVWIADRNFCTRSFLLGIAGHQGYFVIREHQNLPTQALSELEEVYKATNGIKRHLAVDTPGFLFFTHYTTANISDDAGLVEMFTITIDYFKSKPVNIKKTTVLLDHGYHIDYRVRELQNVYPEIMTKIRFERSKKPSKQEDQGKKGFVPAIARWVIERSNAWRSRCNILVKNYERTLANAMTKMNLCFVRLMIKRLSASD